MVGVLLLLAAWYSVATLTSQNPPPETAARQIAARIPSGTAVLLIGRDTPEDIALLEAVEPLIAGRSATVASRVRGEPRDARVALDQLNTRSNQISAIVTTPECAAWSVLRDVQQRFPHVGQPSLLVPEPIRWPAFLTRQNLLNVASQIVVIAILAVGMTLVILTRGIDLSVGSLIALSAVIVTTLIRDRFGGTTASAGAMALSSIAALVVCAGVGLCSGALIAWVRVPPFITTLAAMQVASGAAFLVARGGSIYEVPESFTTLGRGVGPLDIPNSVWLMLGLYALTHVLMTRTILGRHIYAVGGNPEAARLSGVGVTRVLLFSYAFCGAMAGLGGVVQASQLKSGAPTYGQMYELYAIAAVVVGGTSLAGGEGRVLGTLVGAFIIAVIQNGMNLTGVESYQQKIVLGLVILGAVLLDLLKRRPPSLPAWMRPKS
jgi:ribose transport system permease protein